MRHFLISALLISLVSGCSSVHLGPHRIDVQQGNALDQENVSRLKLGLNRSQVRFLLGTPLVVDPFRTDRWDYVYVFYKAGKLAEQKRIALFFDGEILARIEGDMPLVAPTVPPAVATQKPESSMAPIAAVEAIPLPARQTPTAEDISAVHSPTPQQPVQPAPVEASPKAVVQPLAVKPAASPTSQPVQSAAVTSSIVSALPSPANAPAYVDPHTPAALSLQSETNVEQVKPDVVPSFPGTSKAVDKGDESVIKALNTWVGAWMRRDAAAYFASYDTSFMPPGGDSRADWEKRRRLLFGVAKNIEIKIDAPSIERTEEGAVTLTFNQYFRSDSYRDAVVKQLLMVDRDGRWLIVEEKVLSTLSGTNKR
ncbi:MAG: outer membrane protein assembly factor BamE [Sulfuriferula multivorans]|uniref:Outer membrane protein assembly factor BamE n=1 Tax=Sulfuriferula multivorans TaxID=1559896 RepID=A0A7C9TDK2_9PROT|nr:outer membrane protein assembly factor BamE [Sulfuriferula multivorans]